MREELPALPAYHRIVRPIYEAGGKGAHVLRGNEGAYGAGFVRSEGAHAGWGGVRLQENSKHHACQWQPGRGGWAAGNNNVGSAALGLSLRRLRCLPCVPCPLPMPCTNTHAPPAKWRSAPARWSALGTC